MKLMKLLPLMALAAVGCSKTGGTGGTATGTSATAAEKPVATVNGTAITRDMFEYYAKATTNKASADLTAEQRTQLLDNLVRGQVVADQAIKDGVENYLKDKKPTDAELKAEYDTQVAALPKTEYHARHILVSTEDAAQKIIDQLKKGAKFEDLASKESLDSSKSQGGDLGWFSPSNMVKPFADAVMALKKGEITQKPVQTQFGWHVIKLEDTRDTPVPPFDQVKTQVQNIVQQKKFKAYTDELLKTAKIEKNL